MNRPDSSREQSMEEILASIRQSLADEEGSDRVASSSDYSRSPAVPSPTPAPTARSAQSLDRLTDVLKATAAQPPSIFGSKRPTTFDDDLADILDEPSGPVRLPAGSVRTSANGSDMPGLVAPRDGAPGPAQSSSMPIPPGFPSGLAPLPPFPGKVPVKDAAPVAQPPRPPSALSRKGGFYPPQGFIPPTPPPAPQAAPDGPEASSEPTASAATATSKTNPDGVLKRLADLDGVGPVPSALSVAEESASKPAISIEKSPLPFGMRDEQRANATAPDTIPVEPATPVVDTPAPEVAVIEVAPVVAAPLFSIPEPAPSTPTYLDAIVEVIAEQEPLDVVEVEPAPMNGRSYGRDAVGSHSPFERPSNAYSSAAVSEAIEALSRIESAMAPSPAAMNALDALAQGLAASAMSHPASAGAGSAAVGRRNEAPLSVGVLVPQVPLSQTTPSHLNGYETRQPVRTLEDAVTDLLKPMLQQWLSDNMPRIIERALRVEAASKLNPGGKPRI